MCGGLGQLMNVDPTLVRLATVFLAMLTAVAPVLIAYLVAWVIVPFDFPAPAPAPPPAPAPSEPPPTP